MLLGADFPTQERGQSRALGKGWEEGEEGATGREKDAGQGGLGPLRVASWM